MFIGEYRHNIDSKGRLFLPVKFREKLGDEFVVSRGIDECICIYPMEEWKKFSAKLNGLSIRDRDIRRHFVNGAYEGNIDNQGRMTVSQLCCKHANLLKEVVITGNIDYIEIWAAEIFDGRDAVTSDRIVDAFEKQEMAEKLGG